MNRKLRALLSGSLRRPIAEILYSGDEMAKDSTFRLSLKNFIPAISSINRFIRASAEAWQSSGRQSVSQSCLCYPALTVGRQICQATFANEKTLIASNRISLSTCECQATERLRKPRRWKTTRPNPIGRFNSLESA